MHTEVWADTNGYASSKNATIASCNGILVAAQLLLLAQRVSCLEKWAYLHIHAPFFESCITHAQTVENSCCLSTMAKRRSWMDDVPWLCCCVCTERASEYCTLYIAQRCAHLVCGKCRESCVANSCPKCKMEQVEYVHIATDIQNSPFGDFFGDIKKYADHTQKAHEFQNRHFLESCAREQEMARQGQQYLPSANETVALDNKVKQMKSWKKKAMAECYDLERRRKALLELCRQSGGLPVSNKDGNNTSFGNCRSAERRMLTPKFAMDSLSTTPCSLGPPPRPPPVPYGLKKVSGSLHRQWTSPLPLKGRPNLFQNKSQTASASNGSHRGVPLHSRSWEQLPSPMDTTTTSPAMNYRKM